MNPMLAARSTRQRRGIWLQIGVLLLAAVAALGLNAVPKAQAQQAQRISGLVVAIADGDTLTLLDEGKHQHRIRVDGIDAPEKAQAFGDRSRKSLAALAHRRAGKAECPKVDRYGRLVCKVIVDGMDVGLEQIRRGMAWHFKRYASEQTASDRVAYAAAEVQARQQRIGLWRDPEPIAPGTGARQSEQLPVRADLRRVGGTVRRATAASLGGSPRPLAIRWFRRWRPD